MNKKTTGIIFIFCMVVYSTHASFIERVKNLQIRALIERDDLPLPSECTIAICSYLSFDEKKQLRIVCRKFEQYMHHYIRLFPVKSLSDFLYFDYCMRSSGYLFRTQAKILCEVRVPSIVHVGVDMSIQVVLMKKDDYENVYSVEAYNTLLNRSFFIYDKLKVYIFRTYKALGSEKSTVYRSYIRRLLLISVLAEALRRKDVEMTVSMLLIPLLFNDCNCEIDQSVVRYMYSEYKEHAGSLWQQHNQLEKRSSPSFCKKVEIHSLCPEDFLFLFINKNVPTVHVTHNNGWRIETENIFSLDSPEYKALSEKFNSFTQTNSEKKLLFVLRHIYVLQNSIVRSLQYCNKHRLPIVITGIVVLLSIYGVYAICLEIHSTMKKDSQKKVILSYLQGYTKMCRNRALLNKKLLIK